MPSKRKQNKPTRKRRWSESDVDTVSRARRRFGGHEEEAAYSQAQVANAFSDIDPNGVVVSPYGLLAFVEGPDGEVLCQVAERLTDGKTSMLAPGDRVRVESVDGEHFVIGVAPRRTALSRPAVGKNREQVLAANADILLIVTAAAQPPFKSGVVDRFLILAEAGGISPILCVNKMDLVDKPPKDAPVYEDLGIPVVYTCCVTGQGIDRLRPLLENKVAVLAGHSGVGKSSLINVIDPQFRLVTQEVSDRTNKGRHTTTTARLYHLAGNITLIDTPGVREIGLWRISADELDAYFPEIAAACAQCGFRDCTHTHEPNCGVRNAVDRGEIAGLRYNSYVRIRDSLK